MTDEAGGDHLTADGYWGQLKAWGFTSRQRVTERTFTMIGPDGSVANVPCPDFLETSEGRKAALNLIQSIHLGMMH